MVIAPASTGSDNKSGNAVTRTDHTNRGDLCIVIPGPRMLEIVVIKLIEPKMDEIPDRRELKIDESTAPPEWLAHLSELEQTNYQIHLSSPA
ncbi:hypothetical protein Tco_0467739 [Tanacetum coccineum]